MLRSLLALMALCSAASAAVRFSDFPFDDWAAKRGKGQIDWYTTIRPAAMSEHQRQLIRIEIEVPGREIEKHRGAAGIAVLARIGNSSGHWDDIGTVEASVPQGSVAPAGFFLFQVFVQPGEYDIALALCDPATMAHSYKTQHVRVKAWPGDPLSELGRGLPAAEFLPRDLTPDAWFLPEIRSQLEIAVPAARAVNIELLVNTTASERGGPMRATPSHLAHVLSALKVLAGIAPRDGAKTVRMLDLSHRHVSYFQDDKQKLNWTKMRPVVVAANPGITEVEALEKRAGMLQYFSEEVHRSLDAVGPDGFVIVVSAPAKFSSQDKSALPPAGGRDRRLFYVQCRTVVLTRADFLLPADPQSSTFSSRTVQGREVEIADDLERVLRPMGARIYHVEEAQDLRLALAAIVAEMGKQ